jgi:hypothetical protein
MHELFIYYRVSSSTADAVRVKVLAMQQALRASHPGLSTRLLRRPEETAGQQTWMEIYSFFCKDNGPGITPELQSAIATAAATLMPLIQGERHCEVFTPCAW